MPEPKLPDLDQAKRGLQDDHDPGDVGQKQANRRHGVPYKPGEESDSKTPEPEEQA
jgi:hypothetical protein